jgi:O-antigen ligase
MTVTLVRPSKLDRLPDLTRASPDQRGPQRGTAEWTALLALIAALIFQPILHPSGPGNSSPVDILLLATIFTGAIWARSGHHKLRAPYFIPVALMVAAGAASGLVSSLPGLALTTLATDLLLFAWCIAVVNLVSSPRVMRYAVVAWSWAGIFWATVVVVAWLGHITSLEGLQAAEGNRVLFTFGDPNYAATYWVASIFVVYASRTPTARWMRFTGYIMLAWALALSESNGGVLALGVGILFLLLVRAYRKRGLVGSVAVGLVAILAVGGLTTAFPLNKIRQDALNSGQPLLVNSIGRSGQSTSERSVLVVELLQLYRQSDGVVGLGPTSTKQILTNQNAPYPNEAHNDFLAMLTERGVVGLLGLLLLVGTVALWAAPLVRRNLSAGFAAAVPRPAGLVAGLLALGFISYYEEILHFRFLWALLGIVAVLGKDAKRKVLTHV